jgi:hypothetical protein
MFFGYLISKVNVLLSLLDSRMPLGQPQWGFHRVSWALNTLTWHCIDEERGDESFMGAERVLWG